MTVEKGRLLADSARVSSHRCDKKILPLMQLFQIKKTFSTSLSLPSGQADKTKRDLGMWKAWEECVLQTL